VQESSSPQNLRMKFSRLRLDWSVHISEIASKRKSKKSTSGSKPPENQELRKQSISHYENDSDALLKLMIALEFGVVEEEERSPIPAALASSLPLFAGSLPSILLFIPKDQPTTQGLMIASLAIILSLLVVGGVKTSATRGNWEEC
jgi:hypothetical protein